MTHRQELLKELKEAQDRLNEYDAFFDSLKEGQTIYEELTYDSSPVTVISWNKNKGTVLCKYTEGGGKVVNTNIEYYNLSLKPRLTYF